MSRGFIGPAIVAAAELWQGIGTATLGTLVAAQLPTLLTFVALLTAAVLAGSTRLAVETGCDRHAPRVPARTLVPINVFTTGAFGLLYIADLSRTTTTLMQSYVLGPAGRCSEQLRPTSGSNPRAHCDGLICDVLWPGDKSRSGALTGGGLGNRGSEVSITDHSAGEGAFIR